MKQLLKTSLLLMLFLFVSCHHANKEIALHPDDNLLRMGAIYISCESPPWKISMEGILSCAFDEIAPLGLNPSNACALQHVADENGSLALNFSSYPSSGRIAVEKLNNEINLKDHINQSVNILYVDQDDHFFVEQDGVRLKITVKNAYIGGCFHELIQWEEVR